MGKMKEIKKGDLLDGIKAGDREVSTSVDAEGNTVTYVQTAAIISEQVTVEGLGAAISYLQNEISIKQAKIAELQETKAAIEAIG